MIIINLYYLRKWVCAHDCISMVYTANPGFLWIFLAKLRKWKIAPKMFFSQYYSNRTMVIHSCCIKHNPIYWCCQPVTSPIAWTWSRIEWCVFVQPLWNSNLCFFTVTGPCSEPQISFVCMETLKVCTLRIIFVHISGTLLVPLCCVLCTVFYQTS